MKTFVFERYRGISQQKMADMVNKRFNTAITKNQIRNFYSNYKINSGLTGRFAKGQIPWNKDKTGYMGANATSFRPGNMPKNHREVGSERISKDGYIEIKVAEPRTWKLKHTVIYEKHHGKIPRGTVVIFLDQDKTNLDIKNLKLITRKELLLMNKNRLFTRNAELTNTATILTKLISTTQNTEKQR